VLTSMVCGKKPANPTDRSRQERAPFGRTAARNGSRWIAANQIESCLAPVDRNDWDAQSITGPSGVKRFPDPR